MDEEKKRKTSEKEATSVGEVTGMPSEWKKYREGERAMRGARLVKAEPLMAVNTDATRFWRLNSEAC